MIKRNRNPIVSLCLLGLLISLALSSCADWQGSGTGRQDAQGDGLHGAHGDGSHGGVAVALPALASPHAWSGQGCTASACHAGVEPIRQIDTGMFRELSERGRLHGDPDGCVVCHGGDPKATDKASAHQGAPAALAKAGGPEEFLPDPASPWINAQSCGQCHEELVKAQWNGLMMTEAGKIQGASWAFGSGVGSTEHRWGNYDAKNPSDPQARLGTKAYRAYMAAKTRAYPNVFVQSQSALPEAPTATAVSEIADHPEQAVHTYLRAECQRCHLGVKGRQRRGDYRGMGCGSCHLPYGNEGIYEGGDKTIPRDKPGHPLVHRIQGTRGAVAQANGVAWTGVAVETCTTCHNRGKRIGVSYQGLMESAFDSPYTEGGGGQLGLHSKHYLSMSQDVHYQKGMLCQDCHTSQDVHGDGFLTGANLGAVEIECADCHGTPDRYPWELPLGYGDENGRGQATGPARGVGQTLPSYLKRGKVYRPRGGYILTARGNPMPEVVRVGDRVLVHSAGGKDLWLSPLKRLRDSKALSAEARVGMITVGAHIDNMECYACHSSWAPQCYGCHVKVDYSNNKSSFDWVAAGHKHHDKAWRAVKGEEKMNTRVPGKVQEKRSFMRWEDPVLGVNGEGRVTPLMPGCQVSVTIIGKKGETVEKNRIARTPAGSEGSGDEGQLGIDMSPVHPHTVGRARSCESCHASDKALGYGIGGGRSVQPWDKGRVVDLKTASGQVIPKSARTQIEPIKGLVADWSAVVTRDGRQLQTVGHHFKGSGPLSADQRQRMERKNVCLGCHIQLPHGDLATSALHHAAEMMNALPKDSRAHADLLHKIAATAAWAQVGGGALVGLFLLWLVWIWRRRRRG